MYAAFYLQQIVNLIIGSGSSMGPLPRPNCGENNTFQCAYYLPFGTNNSGLVNNNRFYKFEIDHPSKVKLILNPMPNTRGVTIEIYNSEYQKIASKRFKQGMPGKFIVKLRAPDLYYIKLDPASCCGGAPNSYILSLSYR